MKEDREVAVLFHPSSFIPHPSSLIPDCWGHAMSEKRDRAGPNRREVLGTAGALAAGGVLLAGGAAAGAQVEDRGSSIRITGLRASPVGTKAYVKIETNRAVVGWGEITGLEPRV